ncbi:2,3,4,5-tetrahydropyridine-2,6-dicarboxylate N-acetyltransferase [Bombilactobacillus mellifer]|uniref:2,3,4,5-tetrahydropyridine-2,6-dicarboxylate N-acetyltransferase n=1 Tax=Bombilactobacillus mellifer TaxID=1218492 RepID=A0A0F4LTP7_9LACO|nr:2,3,4,5-tetrahydropyridine-2,6-dicarboxylate N-acetyltransferase [Bombilactobacillus mellifer]KJY61975.1 2,3,4,5-tetrahydropyridine-2,6-dicarboxylate N-acetyltransferase [Bombilactobacillus mellifer]
MVLQDAQEIINYIGQAPKKTPVQVFLRGSLTDIQWPTGVQTFLDATNGVVFGDWQVIAPVLKKYASQITDYHILNEARNSAVPLLDLKEINARIEPGAIIRDQVTIGEQAVIMMGAIINIGAQIGARSMIDMGAVLGGRAIVGADTHVGANAVIAGVIEPASAQPVRIGDHVLIGANAVVLEGVQIGSGAVVAAGAVVTQDVAAHTVVAGIPARVVKSVDQKTTSKTGLEKDLRKL